METQAVPLVAAPAIHPVDLPVEVPAEDVEVVIRRAVIAR
jgi:hypothetical protein